ncbi:MAG: SIR2 family protein [Cytophagales bacterium]|nr:SIR2 family protein [Cytophagales bacterium]
MNESIDIKSKQAFNYLNNNPWSLCLGAGICKGILPDWLELTKNVTNEIFGTSWNHDDFKVKSEEVGFSLDSWLQAGLNRLIQKSKTIDEFNLILERYLYGDLIRLAESFGLGEAIGVMIHNPHWLNKDELLGLAEFFENNFSGSTVMQLKDVLLDEEEKLSKPDSIITFNADPILHSLLVVFGVRRRYNHTGIYDYPTEDYVRITRPFKTGDKKIPILHLHGTIYPEIPRKRKKRDSRDNLIFAESSYSKAAGIMSGWAQNVFSYKSTNNRMVFLGLSMSDPNIRRWLSWSTENINSQLEIFTGTSNNVIKHLWIKPKPKDTELENFFSSSLVHLSTKPGWMDSWRDVKPGMLNLMGKK